jgi:hypothetical protein
MNGGFTWLLLVAILDKVLAKRGGLILYMSLILMLGDLTGSTGRCGSAVLEEHVGALCKFLCTEFHRGEGSESGEGGAGAGKLLLHSWSGSICSGEMFTTSPWT